ncbi:MAG TPA: MFS transporter, partial [Steroidobacter sp.]|nr:MFS transporter [Steroidobacter sp.]
MGRSRKIALFVALYAAQGLPLGFFTLALPVLLRDAGFSLKAISAFSLLSLPWALKFLWAPYIDHLGARRSWLLTLQLSSVLAALVLTQLDLNRSYVLLVVAAFAFNILAATQDIVTDGLAVRALDAGERGPANAIQVAAYRLGMILGGGFLLWLCATTNWTIMFFTMALLLALTVLPVIGLREPPRSNAPAPRAAAGLALVWASRLVAPGMLS